MDPIELQPDAKHAVRARVLRPKVENHEVVLVSFRLHFPIFGSKAQGLCPRLTSPGKLKSIGVYFYYEVLDAGEASNPLAMTGGSPGVGIVLIGVPLLSNSLNRYQVFAFVPLSRAGFLMFASENLDFRRVIP